MMNSEAGGDFSGPPNPFRGSGDTGGSYGVPAGVPPASSSSGAEAETFTEDSMSFQPALSESQFVGSGPMDAPHSAAAAASAAPQLPRQQQYHQPAQMGSTPNVPGRPAGFLGAVQSCLSLDTYRTYFDVDTADVLKRVVGSVKMANIPDGFRNDLLGVAGGADAKGPDLYGPFWLTTTMVFFLAVTSNMHGYLHRDDVSEFESDINHLVHAMPVLYSYAFLLPVTLFLVLRCMAIPFNLMELICLYGYSLVPYAPTLLLCLIPVNFLEWIVLLAATCLSCLFILRNVSTPILSSDVGLSKAPALVMFVVACHLIFVLVLKFAFFHHRFNSGSSGSGSGGDGGGYPVPAPSPTAAADDDSGGDAGGGDDSGGDAGDEGDRYY
eukprot:CAMPEP_0181036922 /NCGR_PEP_ID=MMETSP1070-20121207/9126_1 /TAXON_ID=265543 /ORGANISM="Minutocellus polymorphus, Strain NH13" /LENGTH=381 /DNA_ID=CAMNT_0023114603 /DNA_START=38 /DNA_END=1183 /DNA_ORIENTATION=-